MLEDNGYYTSSNKTTRQSRYATHKVMVACLCHFVFSFFVFSPYVMARRQDKITPSEITEKRQAKQPKDEITPSEKTKCAMRNDLKRARKGEKKPCEITQFQTLIFCLFAWCLFVISSFPLALFGLFVFSRCVFSLFGLFTWRYFVLAPRHNARRNDEKTKKTPCEKTKKRKDATRKDEITKRRHAKRRNNARRLAKRRNNERPHAKRRKNEKTPGEKTKEHQTKRQNLEGITQYHPTVGTELIGHHIYAIMGDFMCRIL